jgi:hypothetical protein
MIWMQMRRFTLNQVVRMVHAIEPELRAAAELAQMIDGMLPMSQGPQEGLQLNEAAPTDDQCCSICLETNAETPRPGMVDR